ncbi:hypothetical protein OIDMADRAFT_51227 [Oidiodendron maius Zn]|uniref:Uncharacterized protein n=1 Tax=Oidiodendron maius (strain Zn) TaxID=913774 RepID=A0A0C3HAY9_OIDMZ|nr:hypothetical protein OIDMADRAFT_51227 [Oidiodendron maius Zn]
MQAPDSAVTVVGMQVSDVTAIVVVVMQVPDAAMTVVGMQMPDASVIVVVVTQAPDAAVIVVVGMQVPDISVISVVVTQAPDSAVIVVVITLLLHPLDLDAVLYNSVEGASFHAFEQRQPHHCNVAFQP